MSEFLERVRNLVQGGEVRVSEHGYDKMVEDGLTAREVIDGIRGAVVVEEYPDYPKGPCILCLEEDNTGMPIHVVWGIPKGYAKPAVVVTTYRPDPDRWNNTFTQRKTP